MAYNYKKTYSMISHLCTDQDHKTIQLFFATMREGTVSAGRKKIAMSIFTKHLKTLGLRML